MVSLSRKQLAAIHMKARGRYNYGYFIKEWGTRATNKPVQSVQPVIKQGRRMPFIKSFLISPAEAPDRIKIKPSRPSIEDAIAAANREEELAYYRSPEYERLILQTQDSELTPKLMAKRTRAKEESSLGDRWFAIATRQRSIPIPKRDLAKSILQDTKLQESLAKIRGRKEYGDKILFDPATLSMGASTRQLDDRFLQEIREMPHEVIEKYPHALLDIPLRLRKKMPYLAPGFGDAVKSEIETRLTKFNKDKIARGGKPTGLSLTEFEDLTRGDQNE
jgi:hypothetical protein